MWDQQKMKEFMAKAARQGIVPGLEQMRNLMAELGNVQEELAIIHVAGTNGKGSVCAMTERTLREAGYRTGWYSSPQVFSYEELFRVNGRPIEPKRLQELFREVSEGCRRMEEKGLKHPTLFEIETAVAFLYFYQEKCDVVILEVGMGGRLDATNLITKPLCSVITSVSRDHMKFLGESLTEIAAEKAGIIKEGCPLISAPQTDEAAAVFREVCRQRGSKLRLTDEAAIENKGIVDGMQQFSYKNYGNLKLSLLGACQPENAACVIEVVEFLQNAGYFITEEELRRGLGTTCWPGRFEVVCRKPFTVLDGAHNEDAAKKLRKTLEMDFTNRTKIYIIGVLADKEYEKMLRIMLPLAERVFTVTPPSPRALTGETLCQAARQFHPDVINVASMKEAWQRAREAAQALRFAGAEPMILVFGTLSYLGTMKQLITGSDENDR